MPNSDHTHSCRLMGGGNIAMVETETDLSHRDRSTSLTFIVHRKLPMSLRPSPSKVLLSTQSRNNISVAVLGYSYLCICICEYVFVNLYNVYLYFCLTPVCVYIYAHCSVPQQYFSCGFGDSATPSPSQG